MSQSVDTAAPKGGRKGKAMMLVALPLMLLLGSGAAAAYLMDMLPLGNAGAAEGDGAVAMAGTTVDARDIRFIDLPELLVNLNLTGKRLRFLKFSAALEVAGEQQAQTVRQFAPRIADNMHLYLRALQPEEMEGAEGVFRIKRDLLVRINQLVKPAEVRDVLIKEMLVQ